MRCPLIASFLIALLLTAAPGSAQKAQAQPPLPLGNEPALKRIQSSATIVLGYRTDTIPFSYVDERGQPVGYTIDLCRQLVDRLGKALNLPRLDTRFIAVTADDRFDAVTSGRVDLECGATTNTRERQKRVAFLLTSFLTGTRVMVRTDAGARDLRDLRGKKIGVLAGTTNASAIRARSDEDNLEIRFVPMADRFAASTALTQGNLDGFASDEVLLYGMRSGMRDPAAWTMVGEYLSYEPYAIMLRRDDGALKRVADSVLRDLMHDGTVERIYDKWFNQPIPPRGANFHLAITELQNSLLRQPNDHGAD